MRILFITTPIRPTPTAFPPFGSLALIKTLKKAGFADTSLYDIDALRPGLEAAVQHIIAQKPDILGISAVVSTAYRFTRDLSKRIKAALPDTLIVGGGNMMAAANVVAERTAVDLCVLGEGEVTMHKIAERAATSRRAADFADIPNLAFRDDQGRLVNTGYEAPVESALLYDIDWDDLAAGSSIAHFFPKLDDHPEIISESFSNDPRIFQPHRRGKTLGTLYTSKGCVARCTFCHRWDKGIRMIPVDTVIARMQEMKDRFNLGYLKIADESFGVDHRWLKEFCEKVKPLDLLWAANTRVTAMSEERIAMLRDAGCARLVFGIESGSQRMLDIMEKKTSVEDNLQAMRHAQAAGVAPPIALVIGMPGETKDTIAEHIAFCQQVKTFTPDTNPNYLSINYAQALPGTPLYEYARHKGLIGSGLDGEEAYLLGISDKDSHDEQTTLNFTDNPTLICQTWRPRITVETNYHFVRAFGIEHYRKMLLSDVNFFGKAPADSGYFANPQRLISTIQDAEYPSLTSLLRKGQLGLALVAYPVLAYHLRHFLILLVLLKNLKKFGAGYTLGLVRQYLAFLVAQTGKPAFDYGYRSLRKIVDRDIAVHQTEDQAMQPLRKGR